MTAQKNKKNDLNFGAFDRKLTQNSTNQDTQIS